LGTETSTRQRMKLFLLTLFLVTSLLAFDYDKYIDARTFDNPLLEEIAQIDYDLNNQQPDNMLSKEIRKELVAQQQALIERFLVNLIAGKYDNYQTEVLKEKLQDLQLKRVSAAKNSDYSRADFIKQMTININYDAAKLTYSFVQFFNGS
jgi:hypothetical protein